MDREVSVTIRGTSAKKMAKDIAEGYINVTASTLRRFTPQELKLLLNSMTMITREVRGIIVEENDYDAMKKKNWRLQNLSRTTMVVNHFIKHRRIKM